jgi:autotransporter translocation and assembly factor TamB
MRWRFKIPLIGVVTIVVLILTGLFLLYESHILENWVNRYLAEKVAAKYSLDVTIGEIEGSFIDGFVLRDVLVKLYQDRDTVTLAYVPRIGIDYSLSDLVHRRWVLDSLVVTGAQVYLKRDTTGAWMLPKLPGKTIAKSELPSWDVREIVFTDATLNMSVNDSVWNWFDIGLRGSAKSDAGTYTFRLDSLHADNSDRRLRVESVTGQGTFFEGKLALQGMHMAADSSHMAFSAVYNSAADPKLTAQIDTAHVRLTDIFSLMGSSLTGEADLAGTLYGRKDRIGGNILLRGTFEDRRFDSAQTAFHYDHGILYLDSLHGRVFESCLINAFGRINFASDPESYHLSAHVDSFNLDHLVFNSFKTDLNGNLVLDGRGLNSQSLAIDLDVDLGESHFDIYHFHTASGQMTIGHNGLYAFPGFQITYYDNRFLVDGGIQYDGNITIGGRAELNDLSRFAHQTFIDLPAGRAEGEFAITGPVTDPNIRAHLTSDSLWLYEFYSTDFETSFFINNFTTSMRGPIMIRSQTADAWGFPVDSLYAEFQLDSNLLFIDTAQVSNDYSRGNLTGILDFAAYPQELSLDTVFFDLEGQRFTSDGVQNILIDSLGYRFDRVDILTSGGDLKFNGRINYDETLDIGWDINSISILPWLELISDTLDVNGRLSSTGRMTGTMEYPEFTVAAGVDSLKYRSLLLGDLKAYANYGDSLLLIDSMRLVSPEGLYTAYGEFPINLSMVSGHELFDEREQEITITAADKRLDLASFLLESVEYITGDFSAEIELTGTTKEPHLNGVANLKNGTIKLFDLRDPLVKTDIDVEMSDRLITIVKADAVVPRAKGGQPGHVWGKGTILIYGLDRFRYALNLQCTDLPVNYELGDVSGTADARIWVNGETPPVVTGTIKAKSMYYRESFETTGFSMLAALEADKTWDLDLMVEFPSNFWVQNADIDAEFSGSINILRKSGVYNFLGTLEVIRGNYFFFDKNFSIEPGGEIIYDNIEEPDPKLNLTISTRIRTTSRFTDFESEANYSYELVLAVTGTLTNPIITGAGDTPISSENILPALLADYRPDLDSLGGNPVLSDRITVGGVGLLATQFSRLGTRTLGVETFEIYPTGTKGFDPLSTRLTIGAYTLPNLYVFGSSYFDIEKGQEVGLEYRLGRHYLFEGRRDEANLYHFNFRLNWEY